MTSKKKPGDLKDLFDDLKLEEKVSFIVDAVKQTAKQAVRTEVDDPAETVKATINTVFKFVGDIMEGFGDMPKPSKPNTSAKKRATSKSKPAGTAKRTPGKSSAASKRKSKKTSGKPKSRAGKK